MRSTCGHDELYDDIFVEAERWENHSAGTRPFKERNNKVAPNEYSGQEELSTDSEGTDTNDDRIEDCINDHENPDLREIVRDHDEYAIREQQLSTFPATQRFAECS